MDESDWDQWNYLGVSSLIWPFLYKLGGWGRSCWNDDIKQKVYIFQAESLYVNSLQWKILYGTIFQIIILTVNSNPALKTTFTVRSWKQASGNYFTVNFTFRGEELILRQEAAFGLILRMIRMTRSSLWSAVDQNQENVFIKPQHLHAFQIPHSPLH